MPPKAVPNLAPETIDTKIISLDDISIAEDSGWRELDAERVTELVDSFRKGEYGHGILTIPSVLSFQDVLKKSSTDGRLLLNNGKSTVAALKKLYAEWAAAAEDQKEAMEWAAGRLLKVFNDGMRVDVVEYPEDDPVLVVAWNGLAHDTDSNRYRPTTIHMKIQIVNAQRRKVAGGDWDEARKSLLKIYGASKRTTVGRWVAAAKNLDQAVLDFIQHRRDLTQGYASASTELFAILDGHAKSIE